MKMAEKLRRGNPLSSQSKTFWKVYFFCKLAADEDPTIDQSYIANRVAFLTGCSSAMVFRLRIKGGEKSDGKI